MQLILNLIAKQEKMVSSIFMGLFKTLEIQAPVRVGNIKGSQVGRVTHVMNYSSTIHGENE